MSRTSIRLDSDRGYDDGVIDLAAQDFVPTGATPGVLTRNAKGDISLNQAASLTGTYTASLSGMIFRTGLQDYTMNRFGAGGLSNDPHGAGSGINFGTPATTSTANATAGASGVPVNMAVQASGLFTVGRGILIGTGATQEYQIITAIPDATHITVQQLVFNHTTPFIISQGIFTTPAGVSGPPPFTGVSQFTPPTSRPKGILIRGFEIRYLVGTLALTSITVGLSQTLFKNATALAITDLLAPAANGLTTTVSTNMTVLPVGLVNPVYLTNDLFEYLLELVVVTPATSTFRLYGATLYVTYNFN